MVGPHVQDGEIVCSSWPPIVNRGKGAGIIIGKMAPLSSPEFQWRRAYDQIPEYESLNLKIHPPRVVFDNSSNPDATLVKVDSANRHGCLLEVVQVLTDLDLVITKAVISSDGRWFVDEFRVTDQLGNKVTDEAVIGFIQESLGAKRQVTVREVQTCLGTPIGPQAASACTAIELTGSDHPGILSEVTDVLTKLGCNVEGAEVWTHKTRVACVVYIKDAATGGPIEDPSMVERIKELLGGVMKGEGGHTAAQTHVPMATTHTERRLHQMMLADCDLQCHLQEGAPEREPAPAAEEWKNGPHVSVRNCGDTMYSIVEVKCPDRPKLLFDTVCTLTDMQYVVFHATIKSEDGKAEQEYFIRHMDGGTLNTEAERERVVKCLEAAIERRQPEGLRLELCASDRIGLLHEVTQAFRENGLSITRADVVSRGSKALDVFYVTDANGCPADLAVVEAIRRQVGPALLQVKETPQSPGTGLQPPKSADKSNFLLGPLGAMLRSQSERFLLSLGFASSPPPQAASPAASRGQRAMGSASSNRW